MIDVVGYWWRIYRVSRLMLSVGRLVVVDWMVECIMKMSGLVRCACGEYVLSGCRALGVRVDFGTTGGVRGGRCP